MAHDPACRDFHRTEAQARTLLDRPISRRSLLKLGIGATASIYAARALPLVEQLEAAAAAQAAAPNAPVLVNVFIPGGLDLLDTLVPLHDAGRYADLRPSLHIADAVPLGDRRFGVHPALTQGLDGGLKGLADRGELGFIAGIDYANPDLSHFNSRHFWETGIISLRADSGWLARWTERHGTADNPFNAVSMSGTLSPLLRGTRAPVAAIESPAAAQVWIPGLWGPHLERTLKHYAALAAPRPKAPGPAAVNAAIRQSRVVAQRLAPFAQEDGKPDPLAAPVAYPEGDGFPKRLQRLAGMLAQPLGIRVATVQADGDFDTHDNQRAVLSRDLGALSQALAAFQADLRARGLAGRVLTFVWTEFGRRPEENAGGTDHGAGGLAMVMGARARGGLLGEYPSLSRLDRDDNLQVTTDFRAVYASLLEQWLGSAADEVLPDAAGLGRLQLVR